MKHFLSVILFFILFTFTTKAQYVTIPDDNFRNQLMQIYPSCFNGADMMDTTCPAIVNATSFYADGIFPILNWEGFQYFKNLQTIEFSTGVQVLPPFPATLTRLTLDGGGPTTIPSLPNGLKYLSWTNSALASISGLPNSITYLDCSRNQNLTTINALPTSLTYLDCSDNSRLSSLPGLLPASLDTLDCAEDSLSVLPALPSTLKYLDCQYNILLTSLPAFPSQLKYFNCASDYLITSLPTLPPQLEFLSANSLNFLTSIPALPSTLKSLVVYSCALSAIPAPLPATLQTLNCGTNQLTSIPALPAGLITLGCEYNHITSLPAIPSTVTSIACGMNQLTVMPTLPPGLLTLSCGYNALTNLPSIPNSVYSLECIHNQLTSLPPLPAGLGNLYCNSNQLYYLPELPATLQNLDCQGNHITCMPVLPANPLYGMNINMDDIINCIPNAPNYYSLQTWTPDLFNTTYYSSNYPLCSAVNNINHCDAFPLMTGHVFNDNNNNSIKDANEPYRSNIKVQLSNGAFTFTNSNGYYQIPAPDTGTYTITVTPPNYFTSLPLQYNYHFTTYDTLVTGDLALQATTTVDSLSIDITAVNAARPGFSFPYVIAYTNGGTTTLSPNIVFNYDNTRLIYDSSSNAAVINSGNSLTLSDPGFVAGAQNNFVAYFTVNPAAVIGDSLRAYAHISGGTAAAFDSAVIAIRGSYDPNDKTATPKLLPSQLINGDYIYYTIRFQNTGNDTAFSIVITDTLNAFLQPASLQVVNTSHPCKITVKGNVVYFEFINIMLPDSNVNQLKSHGYVSFRVKPQSNLVINNTIPNYAAIYFDYNSPVITNTAITTIVDPSTVPLKLLSFTVHKGMGSTANVYWQTSNELNVNGYNIEMGTDGRNYKNIVFEKARGDQYDSYTRTITIPDNDVLYFRLKMTDIDGNYSYSNIAILKNDKTGTAFSFLNNPTKDELIISVNDADLKNSSAKIYNAQGALVKTIFLQHEIENVDIKSLAAGTYYLVTEKGSRQFVIIK